MASVNVTIRMDLDDKVQLEKLLSEFGLTMNAAINMFVKQTLREQSIPFKITKVTKDSNVQYLDRKTLAELSKKSDEKYHKAYEELAK